MASSQHRCVFVGNIPYDATEEKLIEICREVGPVVSFRLVIDRETGKPKGYGFCEYKDEETALSARRNLQGYEINGRQLRVDFAENDKGSDRNREQGRGGPGLTTNVGGPAVLGESALQQPIGLHLAITAAALMAEALGGVQAALQPNQNALTSQTAPATDPLTLHLAKMSRSQLNEIISELKKMGTQNKELARKLLLAKPQLLKAIFQIQIMLGMVTSQTMPNIRQPAGQPAHMSLQDGQHSLRTTAQILPQKVQTGLTPQVQGQTSAMHHNSLAHNQLSTTLQSTLQPRMQLPQHSSNHVLPPAVAHSVVPVIPSTDPSVRPQFHLANFSSLNQHLQPSLPHSGQLATANVSQSNRMVLSNAALQSAPLSHAPIPDTSFQPQLASDVDSVLLQQVLKLTPEQLSSLPPEQRQQVIQLQQALRQPS